MRFETEQEVKDLLVNGEVVQVETTPDSGKELLSEVVVEKNGNKYKLDVNIYWDPAHIDVKEIES